MKENMNNQNLSILRPSMLADILNVSTVTIWRMEKRGELPPRKKYSSKCVGWPEKTIRDWMESRPNASDVNTLENRERV